MAVVTIGVAGCSEEKPNPARNMAADQPSTDHASPSAQSDARILQVGDTRLYIPVSWLHFNRIYGQKPDRGYIWAMGEYLDRPFVEDEPADRVHRLIRNPGMMTRGFTFRLKPFGKASVAVDGVSARSDVYSLAFVLAPVDKRPYRIVLPKHDPQSGWVKSGSYYDISSESWDQDYPDNDCPMVSDPASFDRMWGRHRVSDDLVVFYRWGVPGERAAFHPERWREIRRSVDLLVDWLRTEPTQRAANPEIVLGSDRRD
jgi:hypothetical protein